MKTSAERSNKTKRGKKTSGENNEPKDIEDLQQQELSGETSDGSLLNRSETDEDEDEGVGDGNIGRSTPDVMDK
jgi:hypothetical protein